MDNIDAKLSEKDAEVIVTNRELPTRNSSVDFIENLETADILIPGTPERILAEKRLVRKLDCRLVPTLFVIFIMNYIDRNGITSARLKGLQEDLHLSNVQYSAVLAILFVSYSPAQVPSNMILNKVARPSIYIGSCVVAWGLTSLLTGVTRNFAGILLCRVFIGLPEAAFSPGAIYLLSRWYTRKELALRSAIFFSGLLISNAFGSLMAAGILSTMEGKHGIRAWRWLFYIEVGAISIVIGLLSMWLLPDYPHNTSWITGADRRLAQVRIVEDAGEADQDHESESPLSGLKMAITDTKVLLFSLMMLTELLGLSFVNFFPTLTATMGFSTTVTLLLAAPPWILSTILCCYGAWHADKTGERFFHVTAWWWGVILGYIVGLSSMAVPARYVSLFLMAGGYSGLAMTAVWVSNSIPRPPAKRAAAIAIVNGFGNLGNLIGSFVWKAEWGPRYQPSMIVGLLSLVLSSAIALVIRQMLVRENRILDLNEKQVIQSDASRKRVEEAAKLEGITFDAALERRRGYRYLY